MHGPRNFGVPTLFATAILLGLAVVACKTESPVPTVPDEEASASTPVVVKDLAPEPTPEVVLEATPEPAPVLAPGAAPSPAPETAVGVEPGTTTTEFVPNPVPQAAAALPVSKSKHSKFASTIAQLVEASQRIPKGVPVTNTAISDAEPSIEAYLTSGLLRLDDQGRVQVYIRVSASGGDVSSELESLGVIVERRDESGTLIQARVPVKSLPQIAELENVIAVTAPNYGRVNVGSALTEGDALLDFDDLRASKGIDGSGVTLGVVSDGIFGLEDAMSLGDLPATALNRDGTGTLVSTSGGVIATSFRSDGDLEGGLSGAPTGAEGTALLEIVHDIAPGAQLRFANFSTSLEFITAVDFLAANSDVVVDDIGFLGKPYDQSSDVSANTAAELNKPTNPIRGYYTSVGNQALRHYQETYVSSGTDGAPFVG